MKCVFCGKKEARVGAQTCDQRCAAKLSHLSRGQRTKTCAWCKKTLRRRDGIDRQKRSFCGTAHYQKWAYAKKVAPHLDLGYVHVRGRSSTADVGGFIQRARRGHFNTGKKDQRGAVLEWLLHEGVPERVMTLCGPTCQFEQLLIHHGCRDVVAFERDGDTFAECLVSIPEAQLSGEEIDDVLCPVGIGKHLRVINADVATIVEAKDPTIKPWLEKKYLYWDAVWLDFCGSIHPGMGKLIRKLMPYINRDATVAVTIMASRDRIKMKDHEDRHRWVAKQFNWSTYNTFQHRSASGRTMLTTMGIAQ